MDKKEEIGPWKNIGIAEKIESDKAQGGLIGQEDFDTIKQMAEERITATFELRGSAKEIAEIWNQIAMVMTDKCIRLSKKTNRLEEENDGLRSKINSLEYLVREQKKKTKPDAQTIIDKVFAQHQELSHSQIFEHLQRGMDLTTIEAEDEMSRLLSRGYMYEFKTGFYKKA